VSLPAQLAQRSLDVIVGRTGATEVCATDGGPFLTLRRPGDQGRIGAVRVFTSVGVPKIVTCAITVPERAMDTHMIYGFAPEASPVPHFTLDSVEANGSLAFHLDLVPRVELCTHVPYMDAVYSTLTPTHAEASTRPGLTKARIGPRAHAMMSPWMLVNRADEPAFRGIDGPVNAYIGHWLDLVEQGLPDEATTGIDPRALARRDRVLRSNLFDPEVDPAWGRIGGLVGEDSVRVLRRELTGNEVG
jgi:hypothetical protein